MLPETLLGWLFLGTVLCALFPAFMLFYAIWTTDPPDYTDKEWEEKRKKDSIIWLFLAGM